MKFKWELGEKEVYFQKAEQELRDGGIDFMKVDRTQFGVQGWDAKKKTVEKIFISLAAYPYKDLSREKKKKLKELSNWECMDKNERRWGSSEKQIFMHSRLVFQN